ncbi:MAG: prepilin-type N-terminal cleavage/methylation domain-containing protein [Phycisphaerae bacterium]|nr:prepilin-type N-terminal cleavage/methylation domain-containing protein [Phycisphaerae bacterium]
MHRQGFTLTELLVCFLVTAIIMTLMLPALGQVRAHAVGLACLVNIRCTGVLLAGYSTDSRDALPFGGYERRTIELPSGDALIVGGDRGFGSGVWSALFPGEWSGRDWNPGYSCSMHRRARELDTYRSRWDVLPSLFEMSDAVWLDASTMTPEHEGAFPDRANMVSDVLFPSKKAYLFEFPGFCASGPEAEVWIYQIGQTPYLDTSVLCFDGSAARRKQADGLPAVGNRSWPYFYTVNGLRGRDLP